MPELKNHARGVGLAALLGCAALLTQGNTDHAYSFERRVLALHNLERWDAGVPPLEWNARLAGEAGEWADHLTRIERLQHAPRSADRGTWQGENLWSGTRDAFAVEEMVGAWIAEKQHFKPGLFPANSRTGKFEDVGHYTQLMWRSTKEVGCAMAKGRDRDFLVCRYARGGNIIGQRPF